MPRDVGIYIVASSSPRMKQENVLITENIVLQLERDIDVTQDLDSKISLQCMDDLSDHPVYIESGYRSLKIKPAFDLLPHAHYRLTLLGGEDGIRDIRNIPIEVSWSLEFNTGASKLLEAPEILRPIHEGIVMRSFEASWTSNTDAAYYEIEIARTNRFDPIIWPSFGTKCHETKVKPNLFNPGRYYMRVRGVDVNGVQGAYSKPIQFFFEEAGASNKQPEPNKTMTEEDILHAFIEQQDAPSEESADIRLGVLSMSPRPESIQVPLSTKEIRIRVKGPINESLMQAIKVTKERMG